MLDVTRAQIRLTKATYQNRARAAIIFCGWIWKGRRTATQMVKKFLALICISIERVSG
jgi:hypothetical protein